VAELHFCYSTACREISVSAILSYALSAYNESAAQYWWRMFL